MKQSVILSFDYELFFGEDCGLVNFCLLRPTDQILSALRKMNGRAVFFVDYLMLKRMREECDETREMAESIEEQLREIVREGSRIELHLHPHWLDAKYRGNGQWNFSDHRHYRLQSLPQDVITNLFVNGANYLNEIGRQVIPDYQVVAFRAGGWAILPFSKLAEGFKKAGIKVDSSVCQGGNWKGVDYELDFSSSPEEDVYRFSSDVLKPDAAGSFTEVQISTVKFNALTYFINALHRKLNPRKYRHHAIGSYMGSGRENTSALPKRLSYRERLGIRYMFGIDSTSKFAYFFHVVCARRSLTVIMGHPKDFNDLVLENIVFLGRFVRFVTYGEPVERQV